MLPSLVILASYTLNLSTRVLYLLHKDNYTKISILCFNPSHFSPLHSTGFYTKVWLFILVVCHFSIFRQQLTSMGIDWEVIFLSEKVCLKQFLTQYSFYVMESRDSNKTHSKFLNFTPNPKNSLWILKTHSKFLSFTPNSKSSLRIRIKLQGTGSSYLEMHLG